MATTVQVKPLALKNIGNVPDWVLKQRVKDKKERDVAPRPIRRSTPKPSKASTAAAPLAVPPTVIPKPSVTPQPITEEVKDPFENGVLAPSPGEKVRRIYSREFLIKFKYSASPFPHGALNPQDIIAQYNRDFEIRERSAQESSSLNPARPTSATPSVTVAPASQAEQNTTQAEVLRVAPTITTTEEKKIKKKAEGEKKTFKLKGLGATDESILRSPLFRASANKLQVTSGTKRSASPFGNSDDKENPVVPSKAPRSTSVLLDTKRRSASSLVTKGEATKTQKLPTTSSSLISAAPAVIATPVVSIPTPVPVVTPVVATPIPTPSPAPVTTKTETVELAVVESTDAKQDEMDALAKKLKSVMKETDARRLAQRQKQIEYGKATLGYKDYATLIAKSKRKREDPKTPNKYQVCSKRSWDGQIRKWRRMLHFYDPADLKAQSANPDMEGELDLDDSKPSMHITEADILAEEQALRE